MKGKVVIQISSDYFHMWTFARIAASNVEAFYFSFLMLVMLIKMATIFVFIYVNTYHEKVTVT